MAKLHELTNVTSLNGSDLFYVETDPGGTPGDRKLSYTNLLANIFSPDAGLPENTGIVLINNLSGDGTFSGIIQSGTAGVTLVFGDLVYFAAGDSRWKLADADAVSTSGPVKLGMVLNGGGNGDDIIVLLTGNIRADALFPTLTVGAPVYVSTTAGAIQTAPPSGSNDVVRIIGYGNTANELYFKPDNTYIELV